MFPNISINRKAFEAGGRGGRVKDIVECGEGVLNTLPREVVLKV